VPLPRDAAHQYRGRLVEISGCPETPPRWVSYSDTPALRPKAIVARLEQLLPLTRRVGLVATAIGDHPDLARILGVPGERPGRRRVVSGCRPWCPRSCSRW
jgi:hypothetical protein